jgi:dTDP-4-amino-4,6-dideoxygalactose transaminase
MLPIHFNHVTRHAKKLKRHLVKRFQDVIESGMFLGGPQVNQLEESLLSLFGKGTVTCVSSGHDALVISLLALKLNPGDEVIFPVNAYPTAFPVSMTPATPVPVDCDENGHLDLDKLEKRISKKTKAVIIVHLYGLTTDLERLQAITKKHNIILIEDCAQSFGTTYNGVYTGSLGQIGCFSFYPTKNLGTLGDGGALWTDNNVYHRFFTQSKSYGEKDRYASEFVAGHSRIPEIQAGILNVYLQHFQTDTTKRKTIYKYYLQQISKSGLLNHIRVMESHPLSDPVPHLFVIDAPNRERLRSFLAEKGIETNIHYPTPVHLLPAFSHLTYKNNDFPVAERLSKRILSLPFHPYLTKKQVTYIVRALKSFYA